MPGPARSFGRAPASYTKDFLNVSVGTQRASVGPTGTGGGTVIVSELTARVGKATGTNSIYRLAIMSTDSNGRPDQVLGYTAEYTTTTVYSGAYEGETVTWPLLTPVVVPGNALVALVAVARGGVLSVGMEVTSASALYDRAVTAGTTIPLAGYSSIPANGRNAIQALAETNNPPLQPGVIVKSGPVSSQQPTMTSSFSDDNEVLRDGRAHDYLGQHYSELWVGGELKWKKTATATTAERNARQSVVQVGVGGSTEGGLPATYNVPFDTPATYYIYHIDRQGAWSATRSLTFTVPSAASVDKPTTPPARVENPFSFGNITAVYRNNGGLNANAMMAKLTNASGGLIKESPVKAVSIAPNGTLTMTQAESTFTPDPGARYGIAVQARDTNNNWSGYGPIQYFDTNAAPSVPNITGPQDGWAGNTRPTIAVLATDSDKAVGTLIVYLRFYNTSDVQQGGNFTATWNSSTSRYELVTTATHLASLGTVRKVRACAYDGTLYSGGVTSLASATWSSPITISYVNAPTVTLTAPSGSTSATRAVQFGWTCANQNMYRIEGYQTIGGSQVKVFDTGQAAGADQLYTLPLADNWLNGERWNNGEDTQFVISARDSTTLWGSAAPKTITLSYPPLSQLTITGGAESFVGVDGTHYVHLTSSTTTYSSGQFRGYIWSRQFITGNLGALIPGTYREYPPVVNSADVDFYEFDVPAKQWVRYWLRQQALVGFDMLESVPVAIDVYCDWDGIIVYSHVDPLASYAWLQFEGKPDTSSREATTRVNTWQRGKRKPTAFMSGTRQVQLKGGYTLINNEYMTAVQQLDRLYQLMDWQSPELSPNGRSNGICWRTGRGGARSVYHVTLSSLDEGYGLGPTEVVTLDFEEYDYEPIGVPV